MEKHKTSRLVPWADRSEWIGVRKKLLSDEFEDKIEAYEIMNMWKLRGDTIPAFVDITAGILQVLVDDYNTRTSSGLNDSGLRLAYSTSLIRFVNHVHDISEFKTTTLYKAAKTQNIPDWVITMRHDAAHGRELPSIETLQLAAKVSLEWLLEYYWLHEEILLHDLQSNIKEYADDMQKYNINFDLLNIYVIALKIWGGFSDSLKNSLKKLTDLSEDQLHNIQDLVNDCQENKNIPESAVKHINRFTNVIAHYTTGRDKKSYNLRRLQDNIIDFIKFVSCGDTEKYTLIQALLQSDFMLGATQKDLRSVIFLMQSLNCLSLFLETLFELTGEDNDIALNLLNALLPSIEILKRNWKKYILVCNKKCPEKELELMKRRVMKKHTSMMKSVRFPLKLQAPPNITINMVYELLLNPSRKSVELIFKYMNLTHPPLPQALVENLRTLVTAYCGDNGQENVKSDKIYTLDDIVDCLERDGIIVRQEMNVSEDTIWTRSNIGAEKWSSCPIGLLPHQKSVDLNLPRTLKWRTETPAKRKRPFTSMIGQSAEMQKLRKYLKVNHPH